MNDKEKTLEFINSVRKALGHEPMPEMLSGQSHGECCPVTMTLLQGMGDVIVPFSEHETGYHILSRFNSAEIVFKDNNWAISKLREAGISCFIFQERMVIINFPVWVEHFIKDFDNNFLYQELQEKE